MLAPVLSYVLYVYDIQLLSGFDFGPDLIIINGFITFFSLFLISSSKDYVSKDV